MYSRKIRIATRQSPLALWQAHFVREQLQQRYPKCTIELVPMMAQGDRAVDVPLARFGRQGIFSQELATALLEQQADIAVHSVKDVPIMPTLGLALMTVGVREDLREAFISNHVAALEALPMNARVGTSSVVRQCQLREQRPDLQLIALRGDIETRLKKLDRGDYDAIILAVAGLKRLGLAARIRCCLAPKYWLPAVGQGALGIHYRIEDRVLQRLLAPLAHQPTQICVLAERILAQHLEHIPQIVIAAYAKQRRGQLYLRAAIKMPHSSRLIRATGSGPVEQFQQVALRLAEKLLAHRSAEVMSATG